MRLDGALEPHHGAPPAIGRSFLGVRKNRRRSNRVGNSSNNSNSSSSSSSSSSGNKNDNNNNENDNDNDDDVDVDVDATAAAKIKNIESFYCRIRRRSRNSAIELKQQNQETSNITTSQQNSKKPIFKYNNSTTTITTTNNSCSNNNNNNNTDKYATSIPDSRSEVILKKPHTIAVAVAINVNVAAAAAAIVSFIAHLAACAAIKMSRVQQSLMASSAGGSSSRHNFMQRPTLSPIAPLRFCTLALCLFSAVALLPHRVRADDSDNFFAVNSFSMGPETTTPEFDYASRGKKKFGDKCDNTLECGFPGSICDPKKKSCQCTEDLPITNHIDKCGKESAVNESCFFHEQCEAKYFQTECRDNKCVCRFEMTPVWGKDGSVECTGRQDKKGPERYIDPAMIGVLVGMALMFIIICVVLRLFSQARWRENRTIFNTPNPRLMNVSLLRESKLLHGQERRGSRMSVRAPSRQPSMASLRPHSPNPSLGKTGSRSNSGSNASATSLRSNSVAPGPAIAVNSHHERKGSAYHNQQQHDHRMQQQHHQQQLQHQHQQQSQPLITNITSNPTAENVTVEIIEPENK